MWVYVRSVLSNRVEPSKHNREYTHQKRQRPGVETTGPLSIGSGDYLIISHRPRNRQDDIFQQDRFCMYTHLRQNDPIEQIYLQFWESLPIHI